MAEKKTDAREHPKAAAVRKAANALADAIGEAKKAGFAVTWPARVDTLRTINLSETSKVAPEGEEPAETLTGTKVETQPVKAA